ncbi:hypothetical protein [Streptomyces sp. NPDC056132]|uniref:hypothetical protein n=1 Tax=Streptomyces sp. NPDC056132 TaxID=3345722 RepID=UPI0035E171E6
MHTIESQILCGSLMARLGVSLDAAESALLATLEHCHAQSHDPSVTRAGFTPDEYMLITVRTPRFKAHLTACALLADGREADSRLSWEAFVQREFDAAERARHAVPPTALLGDLDAVHRVGRWLGLSDEQTDQFVPDIVFTLAQGYPYRAPEQRHLNLVEMLALVTTEDLTEFLRTAAYDQVRRTKRQTR